MNRSTSLIYNVIKNKHQTGSDYNKLSEIIEHNTISSNYQNGCNKGDLYCGYRCTGNVGVHYV